MVATKKINRKELLKSPDKFFTTSERIAAWLRENYRPVLLAVGCIVVVALVYSAFNWKREHRRVAAMNAYYQAGLLLNDGRPEEAEAALKKLLDDYPGSGPARFSLLDLSQMCLDRGETGQALEFTHKFFDSLGANEASLKPFVFDRLGSLYEVDGQFDRAAEYYQKTMEFPELKENGLSSLARTRQNQGKQAEALELYKQLAADYPASRNLPLIIYNIALLTPPISAEAAETAPEASAASAEEEQAPAGESFETTFIEEDLPSNRAGGGQ